MPRFRVAVTNEIQRVHETFIQAKDLGHAAEMIAQAWEESNEENSKDLRTVKLEIEEL
jgi:hypothetical protein